MYHTIRRPQVAPSPMDSPFMAQNSQDIPLTSDAALFVPPDMTPSVPLLQQQPPMSANRFVAQQVPPPVHQCASCGTGARKQQPPQIQMMANPNVTCADSYLHMLNCPLCAMNHQRQAQTYWIIIGFLLIIIFLLWNRCNSFRPIVIGK